MPAPTHHFFLCTNQRPPGHPKGSCASLGSHPTFERFIQNLEEKNLWGKMKVTSTGCMGPCMAGPVLVCYPEGIWYQGVQPQDVDEIVEKHVLGGEPVQRLLMDPNLVG